MALATDDPSENFYEALIEPNREKELSDEFLINSLDHTVIIEPDNTASNRLKYKLKIAVGAFTPTDFKLKLRNNSLLIKATRVTLKPENTTNNIISNVKEYEEFKREINLPECVETETLVCYLEVYEDNQNFLFIEGQINETTSPDLVESLASQTEAKPKPVVGKPRLNRCSKKVFKSIDDDSRRVENYSNNACLKYKFELREFDSDNISISIRNKNLLCVHAYESYVDEDGQPAVKEFNQEINLPSNIELCNIRNCFDETLGILKIEIPLKFNKNSSSEGDSDGDEESEDVQNENDKYLELMFDLKDFSYDDVEFYRNRERKNVLVVKAKKREYGEIKRFSRKYVLPDWVSTKNIRIFEETKQKAGLKQNLLILNLPFVR